MDFDPRTEVFYVDCPWVETPDTLMPEILPPAALWMEHTLRGSAPALALMDAWAAAAQASGRVEISVKGTAAAA